MFETLTAPEVDKIIRLMGMFRDDPDICNPFEEGQATVL